jgi:hypothetical protein
MAIVAKRSSSSSSFVPCPPGLHQAVCVDVIDMGVIEVTYAGKTKRQHKVRLAWQIADLNPEDGKRYLAQRRYTLSLDDKASLRKDLESWRGKPFTLDELNGFDLEVLIGVNCQINVAHENKNGETYANVTAIVPLGRGMQKLGLDGTYIRVKDRDKSTEPADLTEDDIPF